MNTEPDFPSDRLPSKKSYQSDVENFKNQLRNRDDIAKFGFLVIEEPVIALGLYEVDGFECIQLHHPINSFGCSKYLSKQADYLGLLIEEIHRLITSHAHALSPEMFQQIASLNQVGLSRSASLENEITLLNASPAHYLTFRKSFGNVYFEHLSALRILQQDTSESLKVIQESLKEHILGQYDLKSRFFRDKEIEANLRNRIQNSPDNVQLASCIRKLGRLCKIHGFEKKLLDLTAVNLEQGPSLSAVLEAIEATYEFNSSFEDSIVLYEEAKAFMLATANDKGLIEYDFELHHPTRRPMPMLKSDRDTI